MYLFSSAMEGLVSDFFRALRNLVFTVSGVNPMRAEVVIFQCVKLGTNGKRKLQYLATEAVKMRWENRRLEQDGKEKSCRNNAYSRTSCEKKNSSRQTHLHHILYFLGLCIC